MTDRYSIINIIKTYSYIEITILDSINNSYSLITAFLNYNAYEFTIIHMHKQLNEELNGPVLYLLKNNYAKLKYKTQQTKIDLSEYSLIKETYCSTFTLTPTLLINVL